MDTLARECIQEDREGGDEGLTLTGRHLGDAAALVFLIIGAAVQDDTADDLAVVVDHVPLEVVAAGNPVVLPNGLVTFDADEILTVRGELAVKIGGRHLDRFVARKTPGGGFHDGEDLRKDLTEDLLDGLVLVLDEFVGLGGEGFLLGDGNLLLELFLDLGDAFLEGGFHIQDMGTDLLRPGAEFIIGKRVDCLICIQHLVEQRLDAFHVFLGLGFEYLGKYTHFVSVFF